MEVNVEESYVIGRTQRVSSHPHYDIKLSADFEDLHSTYLVL